MFCNNSVDGVFLMPKEVLKHILSAKETELKVIMYLFCNKDGFCIQKAAEDLKLPLEKINQALAFWRGTGVVAFSDDKKENQKQASVKDVQTEIDADKGAYSTTELAKARKDDAEFRSIAEYTEKATGDLLNTSKLASLYRLYDALGMQSDVIMGIVAHCVSEGKNKIRYIVKTAEGIHNDGVVTYKELESYLFAKKSYNEYESYVKRVIGAGERAFTAAEKKIVALWESEWKISKELIPLAYDRTIALIAKPSLPYMSKIIESWHNEGINDAVSAAALLKEQSAKSKKNADDEKSRKAEKAKKAGFDVDFEDIFEKP